MDIPETLKFIDNSNNSIAYRQVIASKDAPSILFFGGFASNMYGTKASALYKYCSANNLNLTLFDYSGHGNSSGQFTDYTISCWHKNCLNILDNLTKGKQIIIGSSMGGWLMMLTALSRPNKIAALIGISSAPDFTEELIAKKLTDSQQTILDSQGIIDFPVNDQSECSYKITKQLLSDGKKNLLLTRKSIDIDVPVSLLHGMDDQEVPYQYSIDLAEKITSNHVTVQLIKYATHNMSDQHSLNAIFNSIELAINNL